MSRTQISARVSPRVIFNEPLLLESGEPPTVVHGQGGNISRTGVFVRTAASLDLHAGVRVQFNLPEFGAFEAQAVIIHTAKSVELNGPLGVGMHFIECEPECMERLERFVVQCLSSEPGGSGEGIAPDRRLKKYRQAVESMLQGTYEMNIPTGERDDVGKLGEALVELSRTLQRQMNGYLRMVELSAKISGKLSMEEILDHVFDSFDPIIPFHRVGFALLIKRGTEVRLEWARSKAGSLGLTPGYSAPYSGSSLETIARSGTPRIINDLEAYLREHPESDSTKRIVASGIRSNLTCPLITNKGPVGFLFFSSLRPFTYEKTHVDLFLNLANLLSSVVEKGILSSEIQDKTLRLEFANRKLKKQSEMDGLTEAKSRWYFEQQLSLDWKMAARNSRRVSLILFDVDFFKAFNDLYGHQAGDDCLKALCATIQRSIKRPSDYVARYGGEEFVVVLPDTDLEDANSIAEQIREAVERLDIPHSGSRIAERVTVSAGVASIQPSRESPGSEKLVGMADRALYLAKNSGRNRVHASTETPVAT
ncbi:MAG TPA: diguanylate cyclase [Bdellovibrionota bacterium]|nr:diguanylate cyclase [Bdellovibrionota bacterium]